MDWLTKLGVIGAIAAVILGLVMRAFGKAKQAGVDQERAVALGQQQRKVEDANQARRGVGDDDVERLLTNPRDRH